MAAGCWEVRSPWGTTVAAEPASSTDTPRERLEALKDEARRKRDENDRMSTWFSWLRYIVGVGSALLATAAGSTAIAAQVPAVWTAVFAFLAAGLAAVHAIAEPDARRTSFGVVAADYEALAREASDDLACIKDDPGCCKALVNLRAEMQKLDRQAASTIK